MSDLLRDGVLKVRGRLTEASNATLYCEALDPSAAEALEVEDAEDTEEAEVAEEADEAAEGTDAPDPAAGA